MRLLMLLGTVDAAVTEAGTPVIRVSDAAFADRPLPTAVELAEGDPLFFEPRSVIDIGLAPVLEPEVGAVLLVSCLRTGNKVVLLLYFGESLAAVFTLASVTAVPRLDNLVSLLVVVLMVAGVSIDPVPDKVLDGCGVEVVPLPGTSVRVSVCI